MMSREELNAADVHLDATDVPSHNSWCLLPPAILDILGLWLSVLFKKKKKKGFVTFLKH